MVFVIKATMRNPAVLETNAREVLRSAACMLALYLASPLGYDSAMIISHSPREAAELPAYERRRRGGAEALWRQNVIYRRRRLRRLIPLVLRLNV